MSHIVHIAAELAPIAKEGGLGDVVLGLGRESQRTGNQVSVILPKYDIIDLNAIEELQLIKTDLKSYYNDTLYTNAVWSGKVMGLPVFLIAPNNPNDMFSRGCIYGCPDDCDRFLYFCRAALALTHSWHTSGSAPVDVIHHHDWHAAAVGPLYRDIFAKKGLDSQQIIFTVHNFQYQGQCTPDHLQRVGLEDEKYLHPDSLRDDHNPGQINLLKAGVVYANKVTTVSPQHCREVQHPEEGHGLDATMRRHADKFSGIINGLDYTYWNPATDPLIPSHFGLKLEGKKRCKQALQQRFHLKKQDVPLVGCVSRLVPQKGIELIRHAIFRTLEKGGQFVLLGSAPIPSLREEFQRLATDFTDNPNVHLHIGYDEELTHQIFAGSDIITVPSIFEPCGLTQLIALRYGAIPVVRKTGGLSDTIRDVDYDTDGNGFVFNDANAEGFNSALDRAIYQCSEERLKWNALVRKGLKEDHSWTGPASAYEKLYSLKREHVTVK